MRTTSILLAMLMISPAWASPDCLTKREARAKWPKSHIYWSGSDRCWSNHRGKRRIYRDPVFTRVVDASGNIPVTGNVKLEPITEIPGPVDPLMRFLPWDNRVAGQVQP